jgi:hypothetical protein
VAGAAKTTGVAAGGLVAKGAAIAAVALVAGGGLWLGTRSEPAPPAPVVAPTGTRSVAPAPPAVRAPAPAVVEEPVVSSDSPEQPAPNSASAPRSGPSEVELLRQAQAQLTKDPKRALALTHEHKRRFPDGALAQEREVIAVDALSRLGDGEQAKKRADEFDRRYPDSAHRRKVGAAAGR